MLCDERLENGHENFFQGFLNPKKKKYFITAAKKNMILDNF